MTASAVPAVIDALVATFAAALPNTPVYDGPGVSEDASQSVLFVGVDDPDGDGNVVAAHSSQGWAWLGHTTRDEEFTVNCAAVGVDGSGSQKAARDAVYTMLAALTSAIQSDPTLGGAALFVKSIESMDLLQIQNDQGAQATVLFGVAVRARLS